MKYTVFDIETDDLLDDVTKLHCFCYSIYLDNSLIESGVNIPFGDVRSKMSFFVRVIISMF